MINPSRRGFLKGVAGAAGALAGARLLGGRALAPAYAEDTTETPAVLMLYLHGGYNALFNSADSFLGSGSFGVNGDRVKRIGTSDLYVDAGSLGKLTDNTLKHMASIGVRHGITDHFPARRAMWHDGNESYPVALAKALGGDSALKAVTMGEPLTGGIHRADGDVSLQVVRDLSTTIAALGGSTGAALPKRDLAAAGLEAAQRMSAAALAANPGSARSLAEAYPASVGILKQSSQSFNYDGLAQAYGIAQDASGRYPTVVNNLRRRIMGAELMIRAGASVVTIESLADWDTHHARDGGRDRQAMRDQDIPELLKTFTDRTLAMTSRNVVTVVFGDFSRLPGESEHAPNATVTVIGKHVKLGTTGRVSSKGFLPSDTPGIKQFWSYLAAVLKASENPFGSNPHDLVR